jgi:hypothetical protein
MEQKLLYESYVIYLKDEIKKIDSDYSNLVLEKLETIDLDRRKEINTMVALMNRVCGAKVALYWEWYRYIN